MFDADELNPEQRTAATHGEGPSLIVAGAGTGKTTTLAARVAWLVAERAVAPERVLLLTYSRRAARELLTRAQRMLAAGRRTLSAGLRTLSAGPRTLPASRRTLLACPQSPRVSRRSRTTRPHRPMSCAGWATFASKPLPVATWGY